MTSKSEENHRNFGWYLLMGLVIAVVVGMGGLGLAYFSSGSLIYEMSVRTAVAKVKVNGPYRTDEKSPELHWLIYEYDECPGVSETIHLQPANQGGLGGLSAKADTIECLVDKQVGESIEVEFETRVHRFSDSKSWRVSKIAGCPVHGVPVTMGVENEARCPWM